MERNHERHEDGLIDLGSVVKETKGPGPVGVDTAGLEQIPAGLSDD